VQGGERYRAFEPSQPGTQAVVDAVAEGQVAGIRPGDVEGIRVGVPGRIPVGRDQRDDHLGEGWDDGPAEGDVLAGVPERRVRDWCVPRVRDLSAFEDDVVDRTRCARACPPPSPFRSRHRSCRVQHCLGGVGPVRPAVSGDHQFAGAHDHRRRLAKTQHRARRLRGRPTGSGNGAGFDRVTGTACPARSTCGGGEAHRAARAHAATPASVATVRTMAASVSAAFVIRLTAILLLRPARGLSGTGLADCGEGAARPAETNPLP
jgi:hypothetical protein